MLCWRETGQWECWQHLELASSFVDLATIIYGMIAITVEGGVRLVFWAIEQWKNQKAENERQRARERAEGRAEGVKSVLEVLRPTMPEDEYDALLKKLDREPSVNGAK